LGDVALYCLWDYSMQIAKVQSIENLMRKILVSMLFPALLFAGFSAQASMTYIASEADKDPTYGMYSGGHALWFPGLGAPSSNWIFGDGPNLFTTNGDTVGDTASFTGDLKNMGNMNLTGEFDFNFVVSDLGMPKLELKPDAYAPGPGGIVPGDWIHYDMVDGSFTGTGILEGLVLELTQRPEPILNQKTYKGQLGDGANGKNLDYGFSAWFFWRVISCEIVNGVTQNGCEPLNLAVGDNKYGDINIDLAAVPVPAAFWLFGTALLGFIGFSRRISV